MMWKKFAQLFLILGIVITTGCSKIQQPAPLIDSKVYAYVPEPTPPIGIIRGSGIGEPAPDFRYFDSDGKAKSLSDLRGNPILLNFWASWCPPCRAEMPIFEEVYRDQAWRDKGVQFLTVSIDEVPSEALKFMSGNNYTFPFLLDVKQSIGEAYNVYGIPTTFFINGNGVIEIRKTGAFKDKAELESGLKKIS